MVRKTTRSAILKSAIFCVVAFLMLFPLGANADCSDSKIKSLSNDGKTVAQIATRCNMGKSDVKAALDADNDDTNKGLPSGSKVGQCGCWGPANPNHRQRHPACSSGYAKPEMCGGMCPNGGYAWVGVCI